MPKKKVRVKETRVYSGGFPETRKQRDKFYRLLERTGKMKLIFDNKEVIIREVK